MISNKPIWFRRIRDASVFVCRVLLFVVSLICPFAVTDVFDGKKYSANTKCKLQLWVKIGMRRHRRRSRSSFDSSFGSMVVVTTCVWSTSHVHLCPSIHWCAYAMRPIVSSSSANATNYNLVSACTTSNIDLPFVRSASTPIPLAAVLFLFRRLFFLFCCIAFVLILLVLSLRSYDTLCRRRRHHSFLSSNQTNVDRHCDVIFSLLHCFFFCMEERKVKSRWTRARAPANAYEMFYIAVVRARAYYKKTWTIVVVAIAIAIVVIIVVVLLLLLLLSMSLSFAVAVSSKRNALN